jgi:muramoyltetrapeptide carboxypeptidase LdcA involved in peptidoglycan recycling
MPTPLYPKPLRRGSRIAVIAPSSGVEPRCHARLEIVLAHLRAQGFAVDEGASLRHESHSASAPAPERAAELAQTLLREDIDAIIPPWGGELAVELLDRLPWPALQAARPKWVLGYSDTSTWMLPQTLRLNWATAHGPCLMDLPPGQCDALTRHAMAVLALPAGGVFTQAASERWQTTWRDFAVMPTATFDLSEPTRWRCINRSEGEAVQFTGRLVGGCLDTMLPIAASPHGDVRRFVAANAAHGEGTVLFLENAEQSPMALVRAFAALRWAGWLEGLSGVLIGRSAAPDTTGGQQLRYADALQRCLGPLPCPVLVDVDIGHKPPQMTLVNGALATVRFGAGHAGSVEQRLA